MQYTFCPALWTCKVNISRFPVEKEGRKRGDGERLGGSSYIIKQTHIDKGLYTGLNLQAQAGIHTMVGDCIHINSI